MPDRVYISRHHPPKISDRIGAHWFEICMTLYAIARGVMTLLDSYSPFITPPLQSLPWLVGDFVALVLIVGGGVWLFSVLRRFVTINRYYLSLRTGIGLSAIAWLSYFLTTIAYTPRAANSWSVALAFSIGSIGLYVQTFINERTIRNRSEREWT